MRKGILLRLILTVLTLGFILGLSLPALQVEAVIGLSEISSTEKVYAPGNEISELRGRAHRVYQGETPTTFVAEFVGSPEFTRSIADNSWVEYGFSDYGDFYSVQHPWWSVAFYDYYTTVYDETFTEVKIYDDRWVVEYLNKQGNWINSSFWGVVRSYEIVEDGIKLIRTGNTIIGQREEIYYFRNGSPCKIEIKQTCDQAQTIRFVWKPSGIVADTERQIIPDEYDKHAGKVSGLNYYDSAGKFVQTMRWYVELDICDTIIPVVEASAQGRKANVTFGGFAINAGGIAHLDPETFYPDAHVESTSVDGMAYENYAANSGPLWADIQANPGNTSVDDSVLLQVYIRCDTSGRDGRYTGIQRVIILFDTSALPDTCIITGAVLSTYGYWKDGTLGGSINIFSSAPASNVAIVNGDFDSLGTVPLSTEIAYAAWNTAGYNAFTLIDVDTDAFGYIKKSAGAAGITKLGQREADFDAPDIEPTWVALANTSIRSYSADQGGATKPKLVVTYTTVNPPTVTTQAATNVEATTATGNANITVTGGENCDMRGGAWSTSTQGDPGAAEPPEDYGTGNATVHGAFGTGAFTVSMTSLPTGGTIYFRPYAHNSAGWNWGTEVSFLTKPAAPTNVAASSNDETKVVITWTKSTGATDYHVFRGAVDLGAAGDVATFDDSGATAGTITNAGTVTASDGSQTTHVVLSLASEATGVTEYTYKVVASNASGDSDDSNTDNGNRSVGAITYQWQVNDGGGYDNIVGGTTDPYNNTDAPAGTISNAGTVNASDGTQTAHVVLSLADEATTDGATYDYQCIVSASGASNSPQTSDSNNGYRTVGAITYQWQRSAADSDASYSNIGGGTTDPYNDTAAPAGTISNAGNVTASDGTSTVHVTLSLASETTTDGAGRHFQCIVSAVDASNTPQTSDNNRGYRTVGAITYQWQVDDGGGYDNIGGATIDPYDYTGAPAGVITPGTASATDGDSEVHVTLSLAGESVADGTAYDYQCILGSTGASNSPQTSDNDDGYRTTGTLTYQWQRSAADSDADYSNIGGATTDPYNDTAAPQATVTPGTASATDGSETNKVILSIAGESANTFGRYFKCVLDATGASQATSTNDRGYRGVGGLTYQWQRSSDDADSGYSALGGATTDPYNDTSAPAGVVTPGTATVTDGSETAHITLSITGDSVANGAGRYYYCEVSASGAVTQDTNHNRGYRGTGALTYQWQRSANDSDAGYSALGGATTDPYNDTSAPAGSISDSGNVTASDGTNTAHVVLSLANEATMDGAGRWYYCEVSATGTTTQDTNHNRGYRSVGAITYQWQMSDADSDAAYNTNLGTTDPYNATEAPAGIITAGNVTASDGSSITYVTLSLSGESIADGAGRYFQCVLSSADASNSPATSDNNRGYRTTGAITYQWQRSAADSDASYGNIGGATTDPYNDVAAPAGVITAGTTVASNGSSTSYVALYLSGEGVADGAGRYFQCILSATGVSNATSDSNRGYRTTGSLTYQWQRSAADSDASYSNISGAVTEAYNDTAAPSPTITAGSTVASDGSSTAHIALSLSGTSLNDGTGRYYICILNATGTTQQTSATNRGYTGGGSLSYQWQRSSADSDGDYGNIGGATASTYDDSAAPAGIITPGTASASDGTFEAHVVLSLAGESVVDGAGRYYICLLTSPNAAGQTSAANRGYRTTGAITYQWQRSDGDSDTSYGNISGGTTDPYNDTTAPANGDGRWFLCLLDATGTIQAESIHDRGYRFVALVVITNPCTGSDELWAIVNGEIIAGSNPITQTGFEYGLTDTYGANQTVNGTWVKGDEFWKKLTVLTPATVYHYRAMAYDDSWAYGEDRVFSTSGSATIYENLNTGGTDNSSAIYAANWTAMQFTSDNVSHTVTSIRVPLMRVGDTPGTVTLAITHADSDNFSTGADLSYAVLNGNAMTTGYVWYDFDITDITLDSSSKYVIVVKALSGSDTDYILWSANTTGILDDAVGSHSTDSGISWTTDSPTDYLFEIWGDTAISLEGAQVFSTYIEEGDWLFTLTYKNTYTPYYPNEDPKAYFYLQFIDDTTVKAQVNCPMWGYKPGSIYIAKSLADTLEWGSTDYKIRLVGSFSSTPYTDYALEELDWKGDEPTFLDRWVIAQANSIGDYYDTALTVDIADLGEVLNAEGHTMFSIGIPELNVVRPDLFEMVVRQPGYEETDWTHELPGATDWEVRLGPQISGVLTEWGNLINVDGKGVGGFLTFVAFMLVLCLLTLFGNVVVGLCLSYPILLGGAWFGVIDWVLLGVMTFAVAVVFVYKVFLIK